jgi:hypothetical protein
MFGLGSKNVLIVISTSGSEAMAYAYERLDNTPRVAAGI